MHPLTTDLIENAVEEIERREPQYLARFPVSFPPPHLRAHRFAEHSGLKDHDEAAIEEAVKSATEYLQRRGMRIEYSESEDGVGEVVFDAVLDAISASFSPSSFPAPPKSTKPISQIVSNQYETRRTAAGRNYLVRRKGKHTLLLISALGIPFALWERFLGDSDHNFRIIVAENRCGELLAGGMESDAALTVHADDISELLAHEGIKDLHVLGWCNGGRIAINLVTRKDYGVHSLTLLSPTLRGTKAGSQEGSAFEDQLQQIFATVTKNEALAKPLVTMLARFGAAPDWDALANDPAARSAALFAMPAREHASAFLRPMSTGPALLNYARRTAADEAYPLADALTRLESISTPVLLLMGSHDTTINNDATRSALQASGVRLTHATITGAGHYVQDLQYPQFLWALQNFTANHSVPASLVRVNVSSADDRKMSYATT
jgi:pimeloyl-ACP methyl ester carboxylesterase